MLSYYSDTFADNLSYHPTEFDSEDNSSVNYHFVNGSEFFNNCISQIDAKVNFTLALNLSRIPRLSRNCEVVIIIHKKK